jgi:PAS domain S-box-containing protein
LSVENGFLTRIQPGLNDHTVVAAGRPEPACQQGTSHDLEATFCRKTIISASPFSLHDAPNQGWATDRAYNEFGFKTYFGTKIVVGGRLYGTVCFIDHEARSSPFTDAEHQYLSALAAALQTILENNRAALSPHQQASSAPFLQRVQQVSQVGGWELRLDEETLVWTDETYHLHEVPTTYRPTLDTALQFYPEDVRPSLREALRACKHHGRSFDKTLPLITASEKTRWVRARGVPYRDDGAITRVTGTIQDVTQKHRTQVDLKRENELLDRVFETSPTAIAIFDRQGTFVHVSDRAEQILGLEEADITRRSYDAPEWRITSRDGTALSSDALPFARIRNAQEPVMGMEHAIEWPDGSRRLLSVSGAPLHDDDGTFIGAVMHISDITAQWETELSLRESEQRLRGIFDNAALGIALLDAEERIVEANPAFQSMFGHEGSPAPSLVDHPFAALQAAPDDEALASLLPADERCAQREERYQRHDGSTFWGHLTLSRVQGPGPGRLIAMVDNIDLRKTQEEQLRIFRKAIDQTDEAVLIFEGSPRTRPGPLIAYANSAFTDLSGYTAQDIHGRPFNFLHGPETSPRVLRDLWMALKHGRQHEGEAICRRRDGSPFVNHWSFAPVRDEEGTITHWISVQRDVTARRDTNRRLLMAHNEERRRIDQEIHDEMGGLLTNLQMTVEMARMNSGASTEDYLDTIEDCVSELATVTRTISRRLHPRILSKHGLADALSRLCDTTRSQHNLDLDLKTSLPPDARFPSLVEMTAYRVVQEVLIQTTWRADPSWASVAVGADDNELHLLVRTDAALGLDSNAQAPAPFDGIKKWVEYLDGTLEVHSPHDHDMRIAASIPLTVSALPR